MYRYTVGCQFSVEDPQIVEQWLDWLRNHHISDVIAGGASGAEIVKMADGDSTFEIRYRFADREKFQQYQLNHAPRLRDEGLSRFPLELGLAYWRTAGEVVFEKTP